MTIEQRVEQHHIIELRAKMQLAYQQVQSRLRPFVTEQACEGEQSAMIDLFDPVVAQRQTDRVPKNVDNRANRRRRWLIYQDPIVTGEYIDRMDRWRQLQDPSSSLMLTHAAAIERGIDDIIIEGLTGVAYEGKYNSLAAKAFPSSNIIDVDLRDENDTGTGEVGLNLRKLRRARTLLKKSDIMLDNEQPVVGVTADQMDDLFQYVTIVSSDFAFRPGEEPVIRSGKVQRVMGFSFVECERFGVNEGGHQVNPVWLPSAVSLGVWQEKKEDMWNDSSRQQTPILQVMANMDCRRGQDEGVVHILNKLPG